MPGRNEPCPCGSGRKYKHCHGPADQERERGQRSLRLGGRGARPPRVPLPPGAQLTDPWEIDVIPMLASFADDPTARPAALIMVSNGFIVLGDVLARPPAEPRDLAAIIAQAVGTAVEAAGVTPGTILVRHESVAAHLAPLLAPTGASVHARRDLPQVDVAARDFLARFSGGGPGGRPLSHPDTWAGWDLPRELIAALFAQSAAYYRAAPWQVLRDDRVMHATVPGGGRWWSMVLGNAGETFGLSLFERADDVEALFASAESAIPFENIAGAVVSITFDPADDVPKPTRREIRDARWEVAGPRAYPQLMVLNTPGGGITVRQATDLVAIIDAVPRFIEAHRDVLDVDRLLEAPVAWSDPASGVAIELDDGHIVALAGEELWDVPDTLAVSGPEGRGARPGAALDDLPDEEQESRRDELLRRFAEWLQRPGTKPRSQATITKHVRTAELLLHYLGGYEGTPPQAVTEYHLRDFCYRWYPLKVLASETEARSIPGSLRRFFDFLAQSEGVQCRWADAILRDRDLFLARWASAPSGLHSDPGVQEWTALHMESLVARLLLPVHDPQSEVEFGAYAGIVEARLFDELHRRWLVWRDELIQSGMTDPDALRAALMARQRQWMRTPNPRAGGRSPAKAIAQEQRQLPRL